MAEAYAAPHGDAHATDESLGTPLTRRELLNYVWLGSLGVFAAQLGGATVLFALPRFKAGEFGGVFTVGATDSLPPTDAPPLAYNDGKFWLVNTEEGVLALYRVCTHLGCLYAWQDSQTRFICPCHGSQFQRGGNFIQGPAPRSLDAFNVKVLDSSGQEVASTRTQSPPAGHNYAPVPVQPGQQLVVDTGDLIRSSGHQDGYMG
ncbi:MAG: ubiquinol-cytochrome c reductase iron-sulfur subunit [Ardenticatenaceae bacterium]